MSSFGKYFFFLFILAFVIPAFGLQAGVGQPVMVRWQGINYPGHVIGAEGARFHVRYDDHRDGRPDDEWVGADRLRNPDYSLFQPASEGGAATPAPGTKATPVATVPAGRYECYVFISGTGLVNNGGFILFADGSYERGGTKGRFTYIAATRRLTFQGGVMNGRAAQFESRAVPTLHLMGNAGRVLAAGQERPVASCEWKPGS